MQFYADPALATDVSAQVDLLSGGPTDLSELIIPEPSTWVLLGVFGAALVMMRSRAWR